MLGLSMTVRPVKLTLCLTGSHRDCVYISTSPLCLNKDKRCHVLYHVTVVMVHVLVLGREAPHYNYVIKYIALLVFISTQGLVFR